MDLEETLYHILSTSHSGVCIALAFWLRFSALAPLGATVKRGWERVDQCPGSHTPGESAEADDSFLESAWKQQTPVITHIFLLSLSVSSSALCHLWLGFISQTNSLHPNLCLTIFFGGTQTKKVIYYGQQISSTWATISTPEFLTDMHINHGFFPLDPDDVLDFFSEQQLGIDQYWNARWNPLPILGIKNKW